MGATENRRLAEEAIEQWTTTTWTASLASTPRTRVRETVGMAVQRGHEEIKAFYHNAFTGIPDARVRALSVMADDDGTCIEWEEKRNQYGCESNV